MLIHVHAPGITWDVRGPAQNGQETPAASLRS